MALLLLALARLLWPTRTELLLPTMALARLLLARLLLARLLLARLLLARLLPMMAWLLRSTKPGPDSSSDADSDSILGEEWTRQPLFLEEEEF
jgi:hypothetical protein